MPGFTYLSEDLFYAVVTRGVFDSSDVTYLGFVMQFIGPDVQGSKHLERLQPAAGSYQTTEAGILQSHPYSDAAISRDEGPSLRARSLRHAGRTSAGV